MNDQAKLRKLVYALMITIAAGAIAGRIAATERVYEPSVPSRWPSTRPKVMPTFGSNDRARWATIRALVDGETDKPGDEGTFVIGRRDRMAVFASAMAPLAATDGVSDAVLAMAGHQVRIKADSGIIFEDGYQSVDKVMNPRTFEFYSTKPPLVPLMLAGLYWIVQMLTGWTLAANPAEVVRVMLVLVNLVPFIIYLGLMSRLVERYGTSDWGRLFVMAAACFATFLTTFAVTLNNHSMASYSVMFALYPAILILEKRLQNLTAPWHLFVICGFFAGFAFCNEMPALGFTGLIGLVLFRWAPARTLVFFTPPVLALVAGYLMANVAALGPESGLTLTEKLKPIQSQFGTPLGKLWYEYEGSHWRRSPSEKTGIDWAGGKETRLEYALHVLVGHHGLFSLTPIWLLALPGMFGFQNRRRSPALDPIDDVRRRIQLIFGAVTLMLTIIVVGFYLVKSDNYGGFTSGLRWLMWLTPLWLFTLMPAADRLAAHRWGRGLGYVLLGFSVLSVSYPAWNPWRHPWIYNLMTGLGWPGY